jgi:hypothetical protein
MTEEGLARPEWIEQISWDEMWAFVRSRATPITDVPDWDDAQRITRAFEERLYDYYGLKRLRLRISTARRGLTSPVLRAPRQQVPGGGLQKWIFDQHTTRVRRIDFFHQIILQLQRQPVVHVHLNADEQQIFDLEDRDLFLHRNIWLVFGFFHARYGNPHAPAPSVKLRPSSPWL